MLQGEMIARLELDPDRLAAKPQAHGVERLRGEAEVWVVLLTARTCANRTPRRWSTCSGCRAWRAGARCPRQGLRRGWR